MDCDDDSSPGSAYSAPVHRGPSARQIRQQNENARLERAARTKELYDQATAASDRRDFREALRLHRLQQGVIDGPKVRDSISQMEALIVANEATTSAEYRRAIAMRPDLFTAENLQYVANLEAQEKYDARIAADKRDASRMGDRVNQFASSLSGSESMPPNLEFGDPSAAPALEFGDPNQGGAITAFPQADVLKNKASLVNRKVISPGTKIDSGTQLKSVHGHSLAAGAVGDKDEAGLGFDTAGVNNGTLVFGGSSAGGPSIVFDRLPENAQNDSEVLQSVAYFQKLETLKLEAAQKMESLKAEQKTGKGDAVILSAKLETLANEIKLQESEQIKAKAAVKKRVVDLGFEWDESVPLPASKVKQ